MADNRNRDNDQNMERTPDMESVQGRDVAALFDPRPTVVVGACGDNGSTAFATIIWATPISHSPALVAFALREKSHTMGCVKSSGAFSLSILPATEEAERISSACGMQSGHKVDKGALVAHHIETAACANDVEGANGAHSISTPCIGVSTHDISTYGVSTYGVSTRGVSTRGVSTRGVSTRDISAPILDEASSWVLCRVKSIQAEGDHLLVIGEVLRAATTAPRDAKGQLVPEDVLLCSQHGHFGRIQL